MRPMVSRPKSTPSKWDDAQKWLVSHGKNKPRSSNVDDRRLLGSCRSSIDGGSEDVAAINTEDEGETKRVDLGQPMWSNRVSLRDVGTEMTPMASKEPSRTATPLAASTPVVMSPIGNGRDQQVRSSSALESRAVAWDAAEKAKCLARYKREELKIEAWENHETRKAEREMRRMEIKAERMKSRAIEKLTNKTSATRRIAEEKRGNAETKLKERAAKTSEKADYIRRTGHLPLSFFSFKLPSLCRNCTID